MIHFFRAVKIKLYGKPSCSNSWFFQGNTRMQHPCGLRKFDVHDTYPRFFFLHRLWDLKKPGAIAQLELPAQVQGAPYAAFDSTGLVFGVCAAMSAEQGYVSVPYIHLVACIIIVVIPRESIPHPTRLFCSIHGLLG